MLDFEKSVDTANQHFIATKKRILDLLESVEVEADMLQYLKKQGYKVAASDLRSLGRGSSQ
ncbi:hypothetical protein ACQY0O_007404 [Thecaphora frezii]